MAVRTCCILQENMIAVVIFAGLSKRFWPLSEKCLQHIAGRTVLEHQLSRLREGGVRDILLVGGAHNIQEAKMLALSHTRFVEQEDTALGMRGAFLSALPLCGDEPVLLVSGNDVVDPAAYAALITAMNQPHIDGVLLAKKVSQYFPGGYLTVDDQKRILSIVEKPGSGNEPSSLVNVVAHAHRSASVLLAALKRVRPTNDDGYELALSTLLQSHHYQALPWEGLWQPIKYPWHLLPLTHTILSQISSSSIHSSASVHPSAVLSGPVVLSEGVRILPHATVVGPCFIGPRTVIANNALVRHSSIGADCVVGYSTEVTRSLLEDDVWTHTSYVGDSVIGAGTSLGGGTVIGNLRLDEREICSLVHGEKIVTGLTKCGAFIGKGCRTGIHCSISPGVKIGRGSFLASHSLISEDIPEGSFVKMSQASLDIRPNTAAAPLDRERWKNEIG